MFGSVLRLVLVVAAAVAFVVLVAVLLEWHRRRWATGAETDLARVQRRQEGCLLLVALFLFFTLSGLGWQVRRLEEKVERVHLELERWRLETARDKQAVPAEDNAIGAEPARATP